MLRQSLRFRINNHQCFDNKYVDLVWLSNRWRDREKINKPANIQFLVRFLCTGDSDVLAAILKQYKNSKRYSEAELKRAYTISVNYGIDNILWSSPKLLRISLNTLEQRTSIYKDIGCSKILPIMVSLVIVYKNVTVKVLKEQQLLPPDADVTKNLLNCLHKPPPDVPPLESFSDDLSISEIHHKVLCYYFRWKFKWTEEQIFQVINNRATVKHQSLSLLRQMVDILENDLEFTKEKIRRNCYLLSKSPFNTQKILEEFETIGNHTIKALILRYPRLLNIQVDQLHEKVKLLKDFGISDEAISKFPDIFTLRSKTIQHRLIKYQSVTELRSHYWHPRLLTIIFKFNQVRERLDILKQLNIRCSSFHVLCVGRKAFERYIMIGKDRSSGADLISFLCYELEVDRKNPQVLLLKRHPLWFQVSYLHIQDTFICLKENNFSNEAILNNVHITLYKSTQIQEQLNKIDSLKLDESWELTPSRKLALCLYYIEREYHFDGNGIWNHQEVESSLAKNEEDKHPRSLRHTGHM